MQALYEEIERLFGFFLETQLLCSRIRKSPHPKAIPSEGEPLEHSFEYEIKP